MQLGAFNASDGFRPVLNTVFVAAYLVKHHGTIIDGEILLKA